MAQLRLYSKLGLHRQQENIALLTGAGLVSIEMVKLHEGFFL
jgi:hypothetical protein